ncbi:protein kinase family protein [bacterium]|nr:protein kinase family protein [bacterium]
MFAFVEPRSLDPGAHTEKTAQITDYRRWTLHFDDPVFMRCLREIVLSPLDTTGTIPRLSEAAARQHRQKEKTIGSGESSCVRACEFNDIPVVLKMPCEDDMDPAGLTDLVHEAMIGLHALNALRQWCPNFVYTYGLFFEEKDSTVGLLQEKIPGPTLSRYLKDTCREKFSQKSISGFFDVFFQVLFGLEAAQERCLFTHYDLHGENIIIRETEKPTRLVYHVHETAYVFPETRWVPVLIDFGHSCALGRDRAFLGKGGDHSFAVHGMFPFFLPGADVFKMIVFMWRNVFHGKKFKPGTNGYVLRPFFRDVLLPFLGIQFDRPSEPETFMDLSDLEDDYYNAVSLPAIYDNPNDLLVYLESIWPRIQDSTGAVLPYQKGFSPREPPAFSSPGLEALYERCSERKDIYTRPRLSADGITPSAERLRDFLAAPREPPPVLHFSNHSAVVRYLDPLADWENLVACYETGEFAGDGRAVIHWYRVYAALRGFLSYLEHYFLYPRVGSIP